MDELDFDGSSTLGVVEDDPAEREGADGATTSERDQGVARLGLVLLKPAPEVAGAPDVEGTAEIMENVDAGRARDAHVARSPERDSAVQIDVQIEGERAAPLDTARLRRLARALG